MIADPERAPNDFFFYLRKGDNSGTPIYSNTSALRILVWTFKIFAFRTAQL